MQRQEIESVDVDVHQMFQGMVSLRSVEIIIPILGKNRVIDVMNNTVEEVKKCPKLHIPHNNNKREREGEKTIKTTWLKQQRRTEHQHMELNSSRFSSRVE